MSLNLIELVKCAKEAGLSLINVLLLKEEVRYKEQIEREERQKERDLILEELEVREKEKQRERGREAARSRVGPCRYATREPFSK